jgi:hypothetical protein
MGTGMGTGIGTGMGTGMSFNHFVVLFMSQILYVPCKRHGDVYVASVTCIKFSLSEPTDGNQNISSAFLSQVLCILVQIMPKNDVNKNCSYLCKFTTIVYVHFYLSQKWSILNCCHFSFCCCLISVRVTQT